MALQGKLEVRKQNVLCYIGNNILHISLKNDKSKICDNFVCVYNHNIFIIQYKLS